jgi:hypothetical protein
MLPCLLTDRSVKSTPLKIVKHIPLICRYPKQPTRRIMKSERASAFKGASAYRCGTIGSTYGRYGTVHFTHPLTVGTYNGRCHAHFDPLSFCHEIRVAAKFSYFLCGAFFLLSSLLAAPRYSPHTRQPSTLNTLKSLLSASKPQVVHRSSFSIGLSGNHLCISVRNVVLLTETSILRHCYSTIEETRCYYF